VKPRLGVAAVALFLAACGCKEDAQLTKAQYEARAGTVLSAYIESASTSDPSEFWRKTDETADALGAVTPPREIAGIHAHLVHGLHGLADDQKAVADAILSDDEKFQTALDRAANSAGGVEAQRALARLKQRGYRLPSLFGA
jgi:hypothetical protein